MDPTTLDVAELCSPDAPAAPDGPVRVRAAGLTPERLARAGAPYRLEALRGAVRALAGRGEVVLEAPLADADTTPGELVDALREVARLALRCGEGLSFRALPSSPRDPWVAAALAADPVRPEGRYTAGLEALRQAWRARHDALADPAERRRGEILLRRLDDLPRRTVFEMLRQAWLSQQDGWPGGPLDKEVALGVAEGALGERERWMKAFRQYTYEAVRRLVVIPTWQCELRCAYCFIPKQDGRVMPPTTLERSVELLLSTEQPEVMLQFFGGEALLEWDNVRHAIAYAHRRAAEVGKRISYVVSSNGWSLDADRLAWLARFPVELELSLDGDPRTQDRFRASRWRDRSSYAHSIATRRDAILASGVSHHVIMVVHPTNVAAMPANFFHIADLGFRRIQINNMLGRIWKPDEIASFARGLHAIGQELIARWGRGERLEFINMRHKPMAMRLNGEVTVDWDGTIYGGNGFLHETEHKARFAVARLDDLTGVDRYWIDATDNNFLLDWSYRPTVTRNNLDVGKVMASFIKWMHRQGYGPSGALAPDDAGGPAVSRA